MVFIYISFLSCDIIYIYFIGWHRGTFAVISGNINDLFLWHGMARHLVWQSKLSDFNEIDNNAQDIMWIMGKDISHQTLLCYWWIKNCAITVVNLNILYI